VKGYVSMPLGITPKPENCIFLPIPVAVKFASSERPARKLSSAPIAYLS
jgi:translation initiation factor 3 subunit F